MTPTNAFHDVAFQLYTALAVVLLVVGGFVLGILRFAFHKAVDHAWRAYCGWLLIVPVLLICYFLGHDAIVAFLALVALVGFHEFAAAAAIDVSYRVLVSLAVVAAAVAVWLGRFDAFLAMPVFATVAIASVPVVRNRVHGQLRMMALAALGFVYFGWFLQHLSLLTGSTRGYAELGYLVTATQLCDVAAFISGRLFGRHPLRDAVSPKKTWEGAAGGLVVSLALPWLVLFTFPNFDWRDCLILGMMVGIGGQMGDLVVSVVKRDLEIKDMGTLLPGHGGVLDRVDSLVFVAPLFVHYIRWRHGL